MNRPWLIWLIFLICAASIFGAMGVITHRSLTLEQEGAQARADADLQERLRLALWRMETEASALMIQENNRPPEEIHPGSSAKLSPLAGSPLPEHVRLHFDISAEGVITSPQVPPRKGPPNAPRDAGIEEAEHTLKQLRTLLSRSPSTMWCKSVVQAQAQEPEAVQTKQEGKALAKSKDNTWDNTVFLDAAAKNKGPFEQPAASYNKEELQGGSNLTINGTNAQINAFNIKPVEAEAAKQALSNVNEMNQRAKVYANSPGNRNPTQNGISSVLGNAMPYAAPSAGAAPKDFQAAASLAAQKAVAQKPAQSKVPQSQPALQQSGALPNAEPAAAATAPASPVPSAGAPDQGVTPFRPFWLEKELFLVREVAEAGRRHVQGVWLDATSLKAALLGAIEDILPQATLQAVASVEFVPLATGQLLSAPSATVGDPMDLVGLPWKLVPGENPLAIVDGWTPMRLTLAAAWFGALLAAAAAAALLFGVTRLSERRAAFVSSVTHELRTPLTTFRLYSELLEQGMVKEEADRAQYLHTLRSEAERLTHLVDNVLAYSRIERTHRKSRMEPVDLPSWIDRVKVRLEDRAREAGMKLDVRLPAEEKELACVTDATALEQIVFNLVDNACKYAAGRCAEPVVRLSLERAARWLVLRVCDSGPGIPRKERSRLFHPFHKSADEAANSKPGVGLGLALCHRLAGALGGKLTLEQPGDSATGACFVLRLPPA